MGRQLPFDTFVIRKLAKWTARSTASSIPFIDAIGVSPLEEMVFFWNGYKKQSAQHLEDSLRNLAWSEAQPGWKDEVEDEKAILKVLRGVVLRNLRRHEESIKELMGVLSLAPETLKGENKDDWCIPVAHYEVAVNLWMQRVGFTNTYGKDIVAVGAGASNVDVGKTLSKEDVAHDAKLVAQVKTHVETAKGWGRFELDARVGMKITAAGGAIKSWEGRHGGAKTSG
jgi:hypothetical protein